MIAFNVFLELLLLLLLLLGGKKTFFHYLVTYKNTTRIVISSFSYYFIEREEILMFVILRVRGYVSDNFFIKKFIEISHKSYRISKIGRNVKMFNYLLKFFPKISRQSSFIAFFIFSFPYTAIGLYGFFTSQISRKRVKERYIESLKLIQHEKSIINVYIDFK